MKTLWIKSLDNDQKKEIKLSFNSSTILRARLELLLEEKIISSDKESYSKSGYDCPNWAYKQADRSGYKRALKGVISMLK